jgi:hypothetical protein
MTMLVMTSIQYTHALCFYNASNSIVFQKEKVSTLYNLGCKEEWKFKKNITSSIFDRSIILCEGLNNNFQSSVEP